MESSSLTRIAVKAIAEPASRADGTRVLVDGVWPRGVSKGRAAVHAWLKALAPSDQLRRLMESKSEGWIAFRKLYLKELRNPETAEALDELYRFAHQQSRLTLLFSANDKEHNNAVVLRDLLEGMRKPPTGTGPGAIGAMRDRQAKRMPVGRL
jgi:uncharacterized protein YeaO (DUF488 family)